jgi:hypothetical protein
MRYMLIHTNLEPVPPDRIADADALAAWVEEMVERGVLVQGNRLRPVSDATSVRMRDGEVIVLDGPFAETKEEIAGFDIIDCADLDEALEIAAKHPTVRHGTIEVRPFWD